MHGTLSSFLCCELASVAGDGTALAWPVVPLYLPERGEFLLTTSIGFPAKAVNIAREPRVSLLFSDATGSGLQDPPVVLVTGTARVAGGVQTWGPDLEAHWQRVAALQPASRRFTRTPVMRWFMDWYYMRLLIYVTPTSMSWWPDRAMTGRPGQIPGPR